MSVTDDTIRRWIEQKRGIACTPRETIEVCRGQKVLYHDRRTNATYEVEIVHIGPLVPTGKGTAEPASITVMFKNGAERNTTLSHLRPIEVSS